MTYASSESSVYGGNPVEGFEFQADGTYWRYTSADHDIEIGGETFSAVAISRPSISNTDDSAKSGIQVAAARDNPAAATFISGTNGGAMILTIYRGHEDDGEFIVCWKGRVMSVSYSGEQVQISCESIFTSMKRPGLRAKYQLLCRHVLYDSGCGLTAGDYDESATVTDVSGVSVTVSGLGAFDDGYFTGGYFKKSTYQFRTIIDHTGGVLTIDRPLPGLVATDTLTIYPGCDHALSTCASKFSNELNFGGFPWIPSQNPFSNLGTKVT